MKKTPIAPTIITGFIALLLGFGGYFASSMYAKNGRKAFVASAVSQLQKTPQASRSIAPAAKKTAAPTEPPAAFHHARIEKPTNGSASVAKVVPSRTKALPGMVWIPGGRFKMGSPEGVGEANEHPQHTVRVNGFYMDTTEVTQTEYSQVMGANPSHYKGCPSCPVDSVSWNEANEYCKRVGKRLPTEAQWEYAARAGTTSNYFWGDEIDGAYAWHFGNSDKKTHPVAQKKPNAFGLYDMVGNVWEWCADWYAEDYYRKAVSNNPTGPDSGRFRANRGGGYGYNREGYILRCAYRNAYMPEYRNVNVGFRCVR
jgi:formylglycine-generating enzyme required for sulfatase activity